jgi:hypothetical protein
MEEKKAATLVDYLVTKKYPEMCTKAEKRELLKQTYASTRLKLFHEEDRGKDNVNLDQFPQELTKSIIDLTDSSTSGSQLPNENLPGSSVKSECAKMDDEVPSLDLQILYTDKWLDDRIMDAVQHIICHETKQPFQSVLLAQTNYKSVNDATDLYVQLHYDSYHWVASALLNDTIYFADSLRPQPSPAIVKQLKTLYRKLLDSESKLELTVLAVQKQPNANDCGVFAVANAFMLASGTLPQNVTFDCEQMRKHLLICLQTKSMLPFPCVAAKKRGRPRISHNLVL